MKMSTKGRYGLRVTMELAAHYGQGPVAVETIAKNQELSGNYIHVLMMSLRTAGLIRTVRGPAGGYELAKKPSSITALEVVSALEGSRAPVECVDNAGVCPRAERCAARDLWSEVATAVDKVLSGFTIEQLADRQRAKADEPSSYCI